MRVLKDYAETGMALAIDWEAAAFTVTLPMGQPPVLFSIGPWCSRKNGEGGLARTNKKNLLPFRQVSALFVTTEQSFDHGVECAAAFDSGQAQATVNHLIVNIGKRRNIVGHGDLLSLGF